MRITAAMLTAVAVLLLPVTLFTSLMRGNKPRQAQTQIPSAFRFKEVNYSEHRVGAIRVMAPSIALPNWQRQTNIWRKATNSARG